ncbi:carboxypeptidase-like regulatory domain-containing protein [Aquimarina megaterium]|uniref:carboxypeptidase-like regulatory domain-containing protein n=1 Tax=Aquimarina megaterium TaxID=1443666 RepID=UPI000AD8E952|nr:TonB-dependent receptor [Aquimarina megaterium]
MKNKLLIILALLLSTSFSFSQNGSIKGTTVDNTQAVVSGVNIIIKNSTQGVQSDENGAFEITNVADGDHILVVSYLGFKTKEIPFTISNNETKQFDAIILYEGNEILAEVIIEGERRNKFSRKKTAYVAKLPLKDLENTQVYSTVTTDLLKSQVVTNFEDALQNAVGVEKLWSSTGRGGDGAGYYSLRGFSVQPQLVNGIPGLTNGTINAANIEN